MSWNTQRSADRRYRLHRVTIPERGSPYGVYVFGYVIRLNFRAGKGVFSYAFKAYGQGYGIKLRSVIKRIISDRRYARGYRDARYAVIPEKAKSPMAVTGYAPTSSGS